MTWKYAPKIIQWDITSACNLKCAHCRAANLAGADLGLEQMALLLQQIKALCPTAVLALAGGEPLIRRDLRTLLLLIQAELPEAKVELLTNGTLINHQNLGWLLGLVSGFNVSLESSNAEINNSIRGKGAFQKTVQAIKLLVKEKARVAVRMTYFHQGEQEAEKLLYFLAELGVGVFNFRYLVPVGRAKEKNYDARQYQRLCECIWLLGAKLGIKIGFSDPFPEILVSKRKQQEIKNDIPLLDGRAVTGCSAGFTLLYLNPQAIIQLCPYLPIQIADAKLISLKDVWFNDELFQLFRATRNLLEGKCGSCEYKFACGGCRGAAWASGNFLGQDSRCWKL